jgi:hypothetical protein
MWFLNSRPRPVDPRLRRRVIRRYRAIVAAFDGRAVTAFDG